MLEKNVYDQYGLYCDEKYQFGQYEGFRSGSQYYVLMPSLRRHDHLWVQLEWAKRLKARGVPQITDLVPDMGGNAVTRVDGVQQLLFQLPEEEDRSGLSEGETLAMMHEFGKGWVPEVNDLHLYGRWLSFWERRIEQLEAFHRTIDQRLQKTAFDQQFLYTFPYYLGRAETAMQWLVEEGMEQTLSPSMGTINHTRFKPGAWMVADENRTQVKLPLSFVYDHPARDVGECLRYCYEQDDLSLASDFLEAYTRGQPLQPPMWALVGARLLFPLTYVELMEEHYLNEGTKEVRADVDEEKFEQVLEHEESYMKHTAQCLLDALPEASKGQWFTRDRAFAFIQ
ncbi:spore coat putative kinase YutH [Salicibibacter kimchii]|nr:spore coat protein YutH [Salicibibacter kimchii]